MRTTPVTCSCGAAFAANAQRAGQAVNCPSCGQAVVVPFDGIEVVCPCGNQFQANRSMMGQQVNCPGCGQQMLVAQQKSAPMTSRASPEGNAQLVAIIGYLTLVGLIIAYLLYRQQERKHSLTSFHLRQAAGIYLFGLILGMLFVPTAFMGSFFGSVGMQIWYLLASAAGLVQFAAWVYGLVCAVLKIEDPVPVLGELFQDVFAAVK